IINKKNILKVDHNEFRKIYNSSIKFFQQWQSCFDALMISLKMNLQDKDNFSSISVSNFGNILEKSEEEEIDIIRLSINFEPSHSQLEENIQELNNIYLQHKNMTSFFNREHNMFATKQEFVKNELIKKSLANLEEAFK
ncbi:MAG: hypothetical protein MHPSP_002283, partial [Paramarteilia canceri]